MSEKALRLNQFRKSGIAIAGGARPAAAGDGVDISSWHQIYGSYSPQMFTIFVNGSAAATVSSPTGGANGAEVWMYFADLAKWELIGWLNDKNSITVVGANQGWSQNLQFTGIGDKIAVAGTWSAGTPDVQIEPLETRLV